MGLTQKLGTIPLAILTDSSNNVGIGGSPSGSYKFEVTGISRFWDGTQGLLVRAYTGGSGFGAIYSTGVTPGAGNFALAASSTATILSGVDNVSMAINSATKLYINSSGNVGIGTSSPSYKLDITATGFGFQHYANADNSLRTYCGSTYQILEATYNSTANQFGYEAGAFYIQTASTQRMRITSGGNVLIGTSTDNSVPLQVWGSGGITAYATNAYAAKISLNFNSSTNIGYLLADQNNFYIRTGVSKAIYVQANEANGVYLSVGATSWTGNSDERLKNINSNIENALDKLLTLRAVNFSWKSDDTNKENLGLIAQDVELVFPQVIDKTILPSKEGEQADEIEYLGVRYTELIPVLVKAIQELNAKVAALENK